MTLALVLLLIVVVGLAVATTVGYVRGGLPVATPDVPPPLDAPVTESTDLDRARFGLALRGYRMDQVDEVLDGARDAIAERDAQIALLRRQVDGGTDAPGTPDTPDPVGHPEAAEIRSVEPVTVAATPVVASADAAGPAAANPPSSSSPSSSPPEPTPAGGTRE